MVVTGPKGALAKYTQFVLVGIFVGGTASAYAWDYFWSKKTRDGTARFYNSQKN